MAPEAPALTALTVSGDLDAWSTAGFAADDDGGLQLGSVRIRTADTPDTPEATGATGIVAWSLTGIDDSVVDGLLTLQPGIAQSATIRLQVFKPRGPVQGIDDAGRAL